MPYVLSFTGLSIFFGWAFICFFSLLTQPKKRIWAAVKHLAIYMQTKSICFYLVNFCYGSLLNGFWRTPIIAKTLHPYRTSGFFSIPKAV